MSPKYILSIDQSTSATKAVLFDCHAKLLGRANAVHRQYYPQPGWVEHDPEEIWQNTLHVINEVLNQNKISSKELYCLSVTNQRETILVWDKNTGKPVYNAVVWQCLRGQDKCNELKEKGYNSLVRQKTGLIIDPYFSASGLNWILNSDTQIQQKAYKGELAAGTIDSWLIWKLTDGKVHATDYTNACRTLLLNIHALRWDEELCRIFRIPVKMLPVLKHSDDIFGHTNANGIFKNNIPISGVMGDSHAALFGQCCYSKGMSKVTYGTGSSVMLNIGSNAAESPEGLVTSIGYSIKEKTDYAFEGNIHSTGATIKWLAESIQLIRKPAESEKLAKSVPSTEGVYFIPAFNGLGAPYWNNKARAAIVGMHNGTTKAHIVRAALESIAYQIKDLLDLMAFKANIKLNEVRVDGGPTSNTFLMQFQSDILNAPIAVSDIEEASALGAAMAGGLGTGVWKDTEDLKTLYKKQSSLIPAMDEMIRNQLYKDWQNSVNKICC